MTTCQECWRVVSYSKGSFFKASSGIIRCLNEETMTKIQSLTRTPKIIQQCLPVSIFSKTDHDVRIFSSYGTYKIQSFHSLFVGPFLRDWSFPCLLALQRETAPPRALLKRHEETEILYQNILAPLVTDHQTKVGCNPSTSSQLKNEQITIYEP